MSGAPAWLKLAVGVASRIAPGPVARLANRIYRRPAIAQRFDKGARDLLTIAEGMLAAGEAHDIAVPGGDLRLYRFATAGAARGRVLLLHGWTADARAMAAFISPLQEAGFEALIPDLPAHGASFGVETDAPASARAVYAALDQRDLLPDHIIAHSFGGGVAGMMAHYGFAPKRAVSIASPSTLRAVTSDFSAAFSLPDAAVQRFEALVERDAGMDLSDLDALKIWPQQSTKLLILHAPDDAEVDFAEAERLATLPNAVLQPMPGLGHREIVYRQESVSKAVQFIQG